MSTTQNVLTPQKTGVFLLLIVASIVLAIGVRAEPQDTPKMTPTQVSRIATNFLGKIGQPAKGVPAVNAVVPPKLPGAEAPKLSGATSNVVQDEAHWKVTIPDGDRAAYLEVSDTTGQIFHYIGDYSNNDHQPLAEPISKAEAIQRATTALTDAGPMTMKELVFKEAFLDHPSAGIEGWFVSWVRMFHGIPYRDQGVNVGIDAQTGDLVGFSINYRTVAPASALFNISREKAISTAVQAFAGAGVVFPDPPKVKTEVIQPNGYWQPGSSEMDRLPLARVAWICQFSDGQKHYEAWVDTETGKLIGGQYIGSSRVLTPPKKQSSAKKSSPTGTLLHK